MKWSDGLIEDNRTIVEILKEAKSVIENPENWCQGDLYQREDGSYATTPYDKGVCRYCSIGAVYKAIPFGHSGAGEYRRAATNFLERAIDLRSKNGGAYRVVDFNDTNPHSEVMEMWNDAIRIAEEDHESNI